MTRGLNVNRKSFHESDPVHVPGQRASPEPARYRTSATDYRQAEPGPKLGALVEVSALADAFLPIPAARTAREEHWRASATQPRSRFRNDCCSGLVSDLTLKRWLTLEGRFIK
jgi:hypothetical protein